MKVLVAPDKFKGSLTALEVTDAIEQAILETHSDWNVVKIPMADGGEGMSDILTSLSNGITIECEVRDPLFRMIKSSYGISQDESVAFIEMAKASGLQLLSESERNPMNTSSVGTGDLIIHALNQGVRKIILGCGGSATNDGGIGMASALGIKFKSLSGDEIIPIGKNLKDIHSIVEDGLNPKIKQCEFSLLQDVDNPLIGREGAAYTYAKQKGASEEEIELLDRGLKHYSELLNKRTPGLTAFKGAGAAGGFPVSCKAFLNCKAIFGSEFLLDFAKAEEQIKNADLVITGEGKFDYQSLHGKVVKGIAKLCKKHHTKLWILCGVNEVDEKDWRSIGVDKVISLTNHNTSSQEAITNTRQIIHARIQEAIKELH